MNDFKFGNFLYELRTEKGLSQAELGDMFGVSNKAVSKWEMGVSKPRPNMLLMLASFFGVTVEELLAGGRNEKTEIKENNEKDDTSLKLWTGEYLKKKRHAKNALLAAFFLPALIFIVLIIIIITIPNDMVVGPIIIVITIFAEAIDIALILVFYGSARRLKRILYATYPERAEEITQTISPEKSNETVLPESKEKNTEIVTPEKDEELTKVGSPIRKKKERIPMLKWEKICYGIGISLGIVFNLSRLLNLIITDGEGTAITLIVCSVIFVPSLTLMLVATIHYAYRTRRKK